MGTWLWGYKDNKSIKSRRIRNLSVKRSHTSKGNFFGCVEYFSLSAEKNPERGRQTFKMRSSMSLPIGGKRISSRPANNATALALLVLSSSIASVLAADGTYIPWGYQTGVLPYTPPSSPNRPPEANNDDTYAGDLFYSPTTNLLYITGGTYSGSNFDAAEAGEYSQFHLPASDCYVAAIRFPSPGDASTIDDAQKQPQGSVPGYTDGAIGGGKDGELMFTARYGTTDVPDVCSAIVPIRLGTAPTTPGTPAAATNSDHMVARGDS